MSGLEQKVLIRRIVRGDDDPRPSVSTALEEALRYVGMVVQHGERALDPFPCIEGWFNQGMFVGGSECADFTVRFRLGVTESLDGGRQAVVEAFVSEPELVV